jgi:hypothetical protein
MVGPTTTFLSMSAMKAAAGALPGMPRASVGSIEPPMVVFWATWAHTIAS